jgi:aconitate hydratase
MNTPTKGEKMKSAFKNSFNTLDSIKLNNKTYKLYNLTKLEKEGLLILKDIPFSIRILLENVLRNEDGKIISQEDILKIVNYNPKKVVDTEIPFMPARVILQDFTGVPAVVDLAAMRDAFKKLGGNPEKINPIIQSDLVIDHSVQVDRFGSSDAYKFNVDREFERNMERYTLLKWGQKSFSNFNVVPPGTGIVHQVNLEYLAQVVLTAPRNGSTLAYFDTLIGTDSHTTMINGISVLGWGVGGIEAEAVMLGQPYYMLLPKVVGVKLVGDLPEGTTATDLVLRITELLRAFGVVGKFVEYFGPGLSNLSLPDRATLANMAPEYGATMGFFPIDETTIRYLSLSGRSKEQVKLVEAYAKKQELFRTDQTSDPHYDAVVELDMSTIKPSLAGPKRPQDRIALSDMKTHFYQDLDKIFGIKSTVEKSDSQINHGSVVIAAITSCTNTSNPSVMIAAGLVAKKALEKGLKSKSWVKTSLAPGSRVVTEYLKKSGTLEALEAQGFHLVGYGCTTCIGNSGPLPPKIDQAIKNNNLIAAAVLSGNRNFEGRIHSTVKANYLASPSLVVVYALSGKVDIDFENDPIGIDRKGQNVYLKDIWPSQAEIAETVEKALNAEMFKEKYRQVFKGDTNWQSLNVKKSKLYSWDSSTYIKSPPFFENMSLEIIKPRNIYDARVLAKLGDSVTTDHISPAGAIPKESSAGQYLLSKNISYPDFNSFGSRRGNHEVMMRGTFGNIRIKNLLLDNVEGGYTEYLPTGEIMYMYEAAMKYKKNNIPLIILAGKEYGTGSSRDWAAKGTYLLGIKAVIAESFERIHRSNLVGMGVLPLQFSKNDNCEKLGLSGRESFRIEGIEDGLSPGKELTVTAVSTNMVKTRFTVIARLDTSIEVTYYENGGILQTVLRQLIEE